MNTIDNQSYLGQKTCPYTGSVIKLWDTYETDGSFFGRTKLRYELKHDGKVIFKGSDFTGSSCHAIDSDETFGGILGFLSLRPGDTDKEYFESYTEEQREFADMYGEELSMFAMELEGVLD